MSTAKSFFLKIFFYFFTAAFFTVFELVAVFLEFPLLELATFLVVVFEAVDFEVFEDSFFTILLAELEEALATTLDWPFFPV